MTARGNERRKIFHDDRDRRHFLKRLGEAVSMFALRLHGYGLMSNHYHLLIELTEKKPVTRHPLAQRQLLRLVQSPAWPERTLV